MRTLSVILTLAALPAHAQTINEDLKITAPDGSDIDRFGESVAISGTLALVGAHLDDDTAVDSGSAYIFSASSGKLLRKITSSDASASDNFGISVAISGTTVIIGASGDDSQTGSAYIFNAITGQQRFKLTASDAAVGDSFARDVAISGTTAIIGASANSDAGINTGSAYIFDTSTGQQLFKLTASDAAASDRFGASVAISGTTAIVGATGNTDAGLLTGSAYIFDTTTGQQLFKLTAADAAAGNQFGFSVAIFGTTAIVGATSANSSTGAAYIFDTTTGEQLFKITASDAATGDSFGWSVAIAGNIAIVGAYLDDDAGSQSGSAYAFDTTTGGELLKLTASDAAQSDRFGNSVAISGNTAIVGATLDDDAGFSSGSAYIFNANPCSTDLDNSGATDLADLNLILGNFGTVTSTGDTNNDGIIDLADLNALLADFGNSCP